MAQSPKSELYYVRNPISRGGLFHCVKVVGVGQHSTGPYVVHRRMVIECLPGSEAAVAKWKRNRCLEPFDKAKHEDAILDVPNSPEELAAELNRPQPETVDEWSQAAPLADKNLGDVQDDEVPAASDDNLPASEQATPIEVDGKKKRK
jgi:hypothetical protein